MNELIDKWHNCYEDSWKDLIVPEAFAHPAKMAYGLTRRIFKHTLSESWIKPGDIVVDPFGGIGSTGLVGACFGLQVICVELEQKFVDLAKQNFELHKKSFDIFKHFGKPLHPVIIQGDSRNLSEIIGSCDCVVGSPPYAESEICIGNASQASIKDRKKRRAEKNWDGYGQTPGQLGAMKPGSVADVIISSPPYADGCRRTGAEHDSQPFLEGGKLEEVKYGNTPGNLGNLKPGQGETFWQAAKQIVSECHKILKDGGYAIWVVKAFVRNKKIVDFPGDWRRLCESLGFETIHVHHALLVKEERKQSLYGHEIVNRKERKSFFRRLAEQKGSPRIDYEVVLCMKKTTF